MITLNFIETFRRQLEIFMNDIVWFFKNTFYQVHEFLDKYMSNETILLFGIVIIAICIIQVYKYVTSGR